MPNRIKNQAIPLYTPTETLFNEKTSVCEWHEDFFPLVGCADESQIVIHNPVLIEEANQDPNFDFSVSGNTTGAFGSTVTDGTATFITDGVKGGMYFITFVSGVNGIATAAKRIISVDSETQLTLESAATAPPEYYEISWFKYLGDVRTVNGYAEFKKDAPTLTESYISIPIKVDTSYKIQFTITYIDESSPATYILVTLGTNVLVQIEAEDVEEKTYTFYGESDGSEALITVNGSAVMNIDSFQLSENYETSFTINDCSDDSVEYSSVKADIIQSVFTNQNKMVVDWTEVNGGLKTCSGCFYIDVDQKPKAEVYLERITNGDFASCTDWAMTGDVSCGSGELTFQFNAISDTYAQQTTLQNNFQKGFSYNISFDMVANDVGGVGVTIQLLSFGSLVFESDEINATGSHIIETGILTSDCDEIRLSTDSDFDFTIDNVSALLTASPTVWNYRTNCFEMTSNLDCTVQLQGVNTDNAFGIDFVGLDYRPMIRVAGELTVPTYSGAKENEEDSQGISKTLYFKSETINSLFLYQLPMFHHEFIRLLLGYDILQVDSVEYVALEAAYEPTAERVLGKLPDLMNSTTKLRLENDKNVNKFC